MTAAEIPDFLTEEDFRWCQLFCASAADEIAHRPHPTLLGNSTRYIAQEVCVVAQLRWVAGTKWCSTQPGASTLYEPAAKAVEYARSQNFTQEEPEYAVLSRLAKELRGGRL